MLRLKPTFCAIGLFISGCFLSCGHGSQAVKQFNKDGLTIQIVRVPGESGFGSTIAYSARLVPDKKITENQDKMLTTRLWYRMDSCFYLQRGTKKIYAGIIQPIANGVAGSYEYFLSFDISAADQSRWDLIYQDKYLTRKKYSLKTAGL